MKDETKPKNSFRNDIENYLNNNIKLINDQIDKNEELYNEVKEIFDDQKNNSFGNLKTMTEIASTLSKIRSVGIDGADKLYKARVNVLTMEQQYMKLKQDEQAGAENELILAKFNEMMSTSKELQEKMLNIPKSSPSDNDSAKLDEVLEKKLSSGEISKSNNDKMAINKFKNSNQKEVNENDSKNSSY